ncbi:hypothetical protein A1351_20410 [Methylosinus sp. R-45379]|uniref:glycosyltransferase n=1 Tax=Methylosinus sp. R-45379 TaxID=980563 RepID=UPI0007C87EEA|nr:glycosyltransferase [Methylosinus sp. R-45379]OAI22819.1 hypothetical protein A1351_20410 [Methylosinus sp. R-45379]
MASLLFIEHSFRKRTRSTGFLVDLLAQRFDVSMYYLTPGGALDYEVLDAARNADYVVLLQMDFLASVFVAMGKRTVVIPMYDGSNGMPDLHFVFHRNARFLNFSLALHERVRLLGGQSKLVKYFPPPRPQAELATFDSMSAFLWQRRPDHGITYDLVAKLIGTELDHFHVHNAPDIQIDYAIVKSEESRFSLTETKWFEDSAQYLAVLDRANVFIAPRVGEGIGMAMLEAMARGMLILAHDAPTNNEYISNWINGILFDKSQPPAAIHIRSDAARLGRMAWMTVVEGHEKWVASQHEVLDWIEQTPNSKAIDVDLQAFLRDIWFRYYDSLQSYDLYLRQNLVLGSELSSAPMRELIDIVGRKLPPGSAQLAQATVGDLDDFGALDLTCIDQPALGSGWSYSEGDWRWTIGVTSELRFRLQRTMAGRIDVVFEAMSLPNLGNSVLCIIELNGSKVFVGDLWSHWQSYTFSFDNSLLMQINYMRLTFANAARTESDPRMMAAAFRIFVFTDASTNSQDGTALLISTES